MNTDNQAGKVAVLGWIAGFIDGEGYMGLWKGRRGKRYVYVPSLSISNTHHQTIEYLSEALSERGVRSHITIRNVENKKWRQRMVMEIRGMKRIRKLLRLITPMLVTKLEQAKLLAEYIDYRLALPAKTPYSEYEDMVFERLKEIKHEKTAFSKNASCLNIAKSSETNTQSTVQQ